MRVLRYPEFDRVEVSEVDPLPLRPDEVRLRGEPLQNQVNR